MTQHIKSFCVFNTGDIDSFAKYNDHFAKVTYRPCQGSETIARGFSPLSEDSVIVNVGNYDFGRIKVMTRSVPASEVNIHLKQMKTDTEARESRQLTKDETNALKTAITQKLIQQAFPKRTETYFILDKVNHYLFVGATATSQVENVISLLKNVVPEFNPIPFVSDINTSDALTAFVRGFNDEFDELFLVGDDITLEESDVSKIKWSGKTSKDVIAELLEKGKYVTAVNLMREDNSLSFKVDEYLHFSGLKFEKGFFDTEDVSVFADLILLAPAITDLFVDLTNLMKGDEEVNE